MKNVQYIKFWWLFVKQTDNKWSKRPDIATFGKDFCNILGCINPFFWGGGSNNSFETMLMSYCKFWIYWVDVNTKFTIWQVVILQIFYLHPPIKFKIYNMTLILKKGFIPLK